MVEAVERFAANHAQLNVSYWMSQQSIDDAAHVLSALASAEARATASEARAREAESRKLVLPDGWVAVPVEPTQEQWDLVIPRSECRSDVEHEEAQGWAIAIHRDVVKTIALSTKDQSQ